VWPVAAHARARRRQWCPESRARSFARRRKVAITTAIIQIYVVRWSGTGPVSRRVVAIPAGPAPMTATRPRLLGVLLMGISLLSSQQCGMPPWRPAPATGGRRCAGSARTGHLVNGDGGLPMWRRRGAGAASSWGCRRLASSTVPTRSPPGMQLISATVAPWPPMLEIARTAGHRHLDGPAGGSHPLGYWARRPELRRGSLDERWCVGVVGVSALRGKRRR